jgi:hypothetical protein
MIPFGSHSLCRLLRNSEQHQIRNDAEPSVGGLEEEGSTGVFLYLVPTADDEDCVRRFSVYSLARGDVEGRTEAG